MAELDDYTLVQPDELVLGWTTDSSDEESFVLSKEQEDTVMGMLNEAVPLKKVAKKLGFAAGSVQAEAVKAFANNLLHPPRPHPTGRKVLFKKTTGPALCTYHYDSVEDPLTAYRTFLVMGEMGTGKTTLLDAFANYLDCVQHTDTWRWKLVDEDAMRNKHGSQSQTTEVKYYFITDKRPVSEKTNVKIIDSPGFGDTGGVETDEKTIKKFEELFKTEVQELDYILLVVKAGETRWTPHNRYVYDRVRQIFGSDAKDRFVLMCAFAHGAPPIAVETLKPHLHFTHFFPFNNSALYVPSDEGTQTTKFFWDMAMSSVEGFLNFVSDKNAMPMSLTLAVETLETRKYLQQLIASAQTRIQNGFKMLEHTQNLMVEIKKNEAQINENGCFTYEEIVEQFERKPLSNTYQLCDACQVTCCQLCVWPANATESQCVFFNGGKNCPLCPGRCPKSRHIRTNELVTKVKNKVAKEWTEKKKALREGEGRLSAAQRLLEETKESMDQCAKNILADMQAAKDSLTKLDNIAMKPRLFTDEEYFRQMIKHEEEFKNPGYEGRIEGLQRMADRARDIGKMAGAKDITDLFPTYKELIDETARKIQSDVKSTAQKHCTAM